MDNDTDLFEQRLGRDDFLKLAGVACPLPSKDNECCHTIISGFFHIRDDLVSKHAAPVWRYVMTVEVLAFPPANRQRNWAILSPLTTM